MTGERQVIEATANLVVMAFVAGRRTSEVDCVMSASLMSRDAILHGDRHDVDTKTRQHTHTRRV